jgi:hypothetical protein
MLAHLWAASTLSAQNSSRPTTNSGRHPAANKFRNGPFQPWSRFSDAKKNQEAAQEFSAVLAADPTFESARGALDGIGGAAKK